MYFPIGWPRAIKTVENHPLDIRQVVYNRDKILFVILTCDSLSIWFCKPCASLVLYRRATESVSEFGANVSVEWRPDSTMLVVVTEKGFLIFFKLEVLENQKTLYEQIDSPQLNLRRDSAELYAKESVPALCLQLEQVVCVDGLVTSVVCIRDELMVATSKGKVLRYGWDGALNSDYCLDLRRVPFSVDQQVSRAIPLVENNTYVVDMEYSPVVGGFSIVLNDGRAAFLTATSLRFDPNQVQGIWAQGIEDATCSSVNHKFRLLAFGRSNSQGVVYCIDESTGALEVTHQLILSSKDYPGAPGGVRCMRWTPDGCALAVAWSRGGVSLWSTFGALLMCSLGWDYGLHVDLSRSNPLTVKSLDWSAEGYQLWMVQSGRTSTASTNTQEKENSENSNGNTQSNQSDRILQLDFVKSALTVNPCMSHTGHMYLQGEDRLYLNLGDVINKSETPRSTRYGENSPDSSNATPMGSKQWVIVPIPATYSATNWPIRYTAIDCEGQNVAVAGRTGLAHYSLLTRKWKLFGNESQEKDFVVTGGLLWWRDLLILGCYSFIENSDEIRFYQRDTRLDNLFMKPMKISAQLLLLNILRDKLITFRADGQIVIYGLDVRDTTNPVKSCVATRLHGIDMSALCVFPACVVSITLTMLRTESGRASNPCDVENIVVNISGRLIMIPRELRQRSDNDNNSYEAHTCSLPTVLASCVENVWVPRKSRRDKPHLTEALWLFCGAHGMRVWLPLFPSQSDKAHTFMSKRIMLPFSLRIYPLAILFEEAILLGAENDTTLYTSDSNSIFSLPFCVLERTSQVYLHQIIRQLIRRNLGYHAWEIARSCTSLPYFPHSLELLLHEVLEEEATSKEPIPDALLPSVIEFIQEFPVYLQTVVQCARKTEIALWPYLFSAAGKPKQLFQDCMTRNQLDTAASYLIILQNLEHSTVSRQYATLLLDAALEQCKWELSKDLVRFLRAIDPDDADAESPRTSFVVRGTGYGVGGVTPAPPLEEDLSLVLGTMQVSRGRSYSTTVTPKLPLQPLQQGEGHKEVQRTASVGGEVTKAAVVRRKKSVPVGAQESREPSSSAEEFFIDVILQRHARRLLTGQRLLDLGHFAAHLDFHPVAWLARERDRAARVENFVSALKQLHADFSWPYPVLTQPVAFYLQRKVSHTSSSSPALSPVMEDRVKGGVDDSGYHSHSQHTMVMHTPSLLNSDSNGQMVEAQLMPHHVGDSASLLSEESGWGEDLQGGVEGGWADLKALEQLSQEVPNKGSHKAEIQLRYLLQLLMEAGCLEWAVEVAVLLRDAMAVFRVVYAARSADQSASSVQRLRDGIVCLLQWTNAQCLGYKPFMVTIQSQITVLNKILLMKEQQQRALASRPRHDSGVSGSPPGRRSRKTSSNQDATAGGAAPAQSAATPEAADKTSSAAKSSEDRSSKGGKSVTGAPADDAPGVTQTDAEPAHVEAESSGCVIS